VFDIVKIVIINHISINLIACIHAQDHTKQNSILQSKIEAYIIIF